MGTFSNKATKIRKALVLALAFVIGYSVGKYSGPAEVREVEKIVYKESIDEKKNLTTIVNTKEVVLPDGTQIKESFTETKDKTETISIVDVEQKRESIRIGNNGPDWRINVLYNPPTPLWGERYTLDIQRRIIGEIAVGINASTDKSLGISLSIGF